LTERSDLFAEYFGKIIIVADTRNHRRISRQCDGRERWPLNDESINKFSRKMLGVGSGTAIAEKHYFVSGFQGCRNNFYNVYKFAQILVKKIVFDPVTLFKYLYDVIFHTYLA